jgi:hypothetical protein
MKPSNKISTLRSRGVSVVNCAGNVCRIASPVPFCYGPKTVEEKSPQGDYRLDIRGQYFNSLPCAIGFFD